MLRDIMCVDRIPPFQDPALHTALLIGKPHQPLLTRKIELASALLHPSANLHQVTFLGSKYARYSSKLILRIH